MIDVQCRVCDDKAGVDAADGAVMDLLAAANCSQRQVRCSETANEVCSSGCLRGVCVCEGRQVILVLWPENTHAIC
jgi:hypothetical protein